MALVERLALHLADKAPPVVVLDYKHIVQSEHVPTPYKGSPGLGQHLAFGNSLSVE